MQRFLSVAFVGLGVATAGQSAFSQTSASGAGDSAAQVRVPALDVISVKPDKAGDVGGGFGPTPDGVMGKNITAHLMLMTAYHLNEKQIINEPKWADEDHFDINGKVSAADAAIVPGLPVEQKRQDFFQQVLKARFGLVAHHETRKLREYALMPAKGGVKIEDGKPNPNATPEMKQFSGFRTSYGPATTIEFGNARIDPLLLILANIAGRPVVDRTGLTGKYSFTLKFKSAMEKGGADDADSTPDLFTAIQEQLGLKLEPTKGPVDVLVIDHMERPTSN